MLPICKHHTDGVVSHSSSQNMMILNVTLNTTFTKQNTCNNVLNNKR